MSLVEILGYAAAVVLVVAFAMKTIAWLRYVAIASSIVLGAYGLVAGHYAVLAIAALILVINVFRLVEMRRLAVATQVATAGAGAPITMDWLLQHMHRIERGKGEVIFRNGDAADAMYFIQSGRVGITELGVEIDKGNLFGEIGVLSYGQARTATAVCLEPCTLLKISADRVRELYFENPEFGFFLVGVVTNRLLEDLGRARGRRPA